MKDAFDVGGESLGTVVGETADSVTIDTDGGSGAAAGIMAIIAFLLFAPVYFLRLHYLSKGKKADFGQKVVAGLISFSITPLLFYGSLWAYMEINKPAPLTPAQLNKAGAVTVATPPAVKKAQTRPISSYKDLPDFVNPGNIRRLPKPSYTAAGYEEAVKSKKCRLAIIEGINWANNQADKESLMMQLGPYTDDVEGTMLTDLTIKEFQVVNGKLQGSYLLRGAMYNSAGQKVILSATGKLYAVWIEEKERTREVAAVLVGPSK